MFKAGRLIDQAGEDSFARNLIMVPICKMLSQIDGELLLEDYTKKISKLMGVKPTTISNELRKETKKKEEEKVQVLNENESALPTWVDKDHFHAHTFIQRVDHQHKEKTGIYFANGDNLPKQLTNFTLKAIAHVMMDGDGNRRLAEIDNGYRQEVVELPSRLWSSTDSFENALNEKGVFYTKDGFNKSHLTRLKAYFFPEFKQCYELENLGWQDEGFYAYSNLIFHEGIIKYDEYGIATVGDTNYLSMGVSKVLASLRKNKSLYENDKFLKYIESPISFHEWTQLMRDAYLDKGMMGVCFAIMGCFKDLIFSRNNNCPLPYAVGPAQSGKTKFMESVCNIFTHNMPMLNLNQTTEYALWERLSRFGNVPMGFNEFDEQSIKEEFTRAFKGAFDGEGRNRGTGKKGKAETQMVNCLAMLLGQYLTTSDDGAVLQRTLPEKFTEDNDRPEEQVKRFEELKNLEKLGITSLSCEVIKHRGYVSEHYSEKYAELSKKMKQALAQENLTPKTRILENYVNAIVVTFLVMDQIPMAFTEDEFFEYCKKQIISLSLIINESNALSGFWQMMEFMIDQEMVEQGYHFKIETKSEVTVAADRKDDIKKTFAEPKKLLYLRLNTIHTIYMSEMRKIGKRGIDLQTILIYMKDQPSYIGNSPSGGFRGKRSGSTNTSSFVFDYDMLKVNLERFDDNMDSVPVVVTGKISQSAEQIYVCGVPKLKFTIVQFENGFSDGKIVEKKTYTKCFYRDVNALDALILDAPVVITGSLEVKYSPTGDFRTMEVQHLDLSAKEMKF